MAITRGGQRDRSRASPPSQRDSSAPRSITRAEMHSSPASNSSANPASSQEIAPINNAPPAQMAPNHDVSLTAEQMADIKAGNKNLLIIYVPSPDPGPGAIAPRDIAYLICQETFNVYQGSGSGSGLGKNLGTARALFPTVAREMQAAIMVRDERNAQETARMVIHETNTPGKRGAKWELMDPDAVFVRAKLNQPSAEALIIVFIDKNDGELVFERYHTKPGFDWGSQAQISKVNHWRGQIMTRRKVALVRFDKSLDEMWTVREQTELERIVKHIIVYHTRRGLQKMEIFARIKWDVVQTALEQHCADGHRAGVPLSIKCDTDVAGEGFHQRRTLLSARASFCQTMEAIERRALDTMDAIMSPLVENNEEVFTAPESHAFLVLNPVSQENSERLAKKVEHSKKEKLRKVHAAGVEKHKLRKQGAAPHDPKKNTAAMAAAALLVKDASPNSSAGSPRSARGRKSLIVKLRLPGASTDVAMSDVRDGNGDDGVDGDHENAMSTPKTKANSKTTPILKTTPLRRSTRARTPAPTSSPSAQLLAFQAAEDAKFRKGSEKNAPEKAVPRVQDPLAFLDAESEDEERQGRPSPDTYPAHWTFQQCMTAYLEDKSGKLPIQIAAVWV